MRNEDRKKKYEEVEILNEEIEKLRGMIFRIDCRHHKRSVIA